MKKKVLWFLESLKGEVVDGIHLGQPSGRTWSVCQIWRLAAQRSLQTDRQTSDESYLFDLFRFQLCVESGQLCSE